MKLSKMERVNLVHQHRILQKLYPDEAAAHEKAADILMNGYEYLYDELYQFVYSDEDAMSEHECLEVWETLEMFDSIDRTMKALELEHSSDRTTVFFGYDGNSEGKFLGFAEFTITKGGRFSYLPLARNNYFNSHMPARGIYQRMLEIWNAIDRSARFPMSQANLELVLDAAIHPSNR